MLSFAPAPVGPTDKDIKLKMTLPVPQMAYFTRVLMEIGVIENKNASEVVRFMIKNFSTNKAENISMESFRTKFYTDDPKAKEGVKDIAIQMLNFVNKKT